MTQRTTTVMVCLLLATVGFGLLIAETKEQKKTIVGKDGAEMVLIPAGEFQMGSNHGFVLLAKAELRAKLRLRTTKNRYTRSTLMLFTWTNTK